MTDLNEVKEMLEIALSAASITATVTLCPDQVEDDAPAGSLSFGAWTIYPTAKGWALDRAVLCPGVRYYPDGSGEPDTTDVVRVFESSSVVEVVKTAVVEQVKEDIGNALEIWGESKWAKMDSDGEFQMA